MRFGLRLEVWQEGRVTIEPGLPRELALSAFETRVLARALLETDALTDAELEDELRRRRERARGALHDDERPES